MAWAIFLAFILYPLHTWLTRKLGGRNGVSAGILTGLTPFVLLVPLTFLGIAFVNQARALVDYLQERNLKLDGSLLLQLEKYPVIGPLARMAREQLLVSGTDIQDWLANSAQGLLQERRVGRWRLRAVGARHADRLLLHAVHPVLHAARRRVDVRPRCSD